MSLHGWIITIVCTVLWVLVFRIIKRFWKKNIVTMFRYSYPDDIEEQNRMQQQDIIAFCLLFFLLICRHI